MQMQMWGSLWKEQATVAMQAVKIHASMTVRTRTTRVIYHTPADRDAAVSALQYVLHRRCIQDSIT